MAHITGRYPHRNLVAFDDGDGGTLCYTCAAAKWDFAERRESQMTRIEESGLTATEMAELPANGMHCSSCEQHVIVGKEFDEMSMSEVIEEVIRACANDQ
jgi:hypothetical protein